jgi:hypothetical protein
MNTENAQLQPMTETECTETEGGLGFDLAAMLNLNVLGLSLGSVEGEVKFDISL